MPGLHISLVIREGLMQEANFQQTKFDRLGFITRQLPILVLAIWWVIERMRRKDSIGIIVLYVGIALFLTVLNYLGARRS
jgi:hypothetical protein